MTEHPAPTDELGDHDSLARLYAKLADTRNTVSADALLDRILAHPDYVAPDSRP